MLTNYHTHTTLCDGKSTPEEVVLSAIEKGFDALGFSGHGFTPFDHRYCMSDEQAYINTVTALKQQYAHRIQLYVGSEEDILHPVDRSRYEYIVGSSHYFAANGSYYPIDSGIDYFNRCLELFNGDPLALAESYYRTFCEYLRERKPDIIGHFDLITKFDEQYTHAFLGESAYQKLAKHYTLEAIKSDCLFEVNTGAISRGYRTTPYPDEQLLYAIKKTTAENWFYARIPITQTRWIFILKRAVRCCATSVLNTSTRCTTEHGSRIICKEKTS